MGFGEFLALDLRTGIVVMAEEFPEMRKPSYKITVDFGPVVGRLQSSAQITNYSRADLVGRMVVGAINLGEKTLPGGFVSQFLVLGALDPDGTVRLLEMPDGVLPGSMVA
ncbi:MAG TPA: tRNA-binding protein [Candidatus Poseidoniales archaeon]|nr:MAG: tRNA-binding protein [Euryarchaeota archaeon]HIE80974.1 tRNA-binding protein [Candidatus Poseidoniales archaeon]HIL50099.1 tRNA-binding protein [Candidatus Poseidoniales archaeon]